MSVAHIEPVGSMRRILFLFGAGASYGAGGVLPNPPPLGDWVYEELARCHPSTWGSLPSSVGEQLSEDFEGGMGTVYQNYQRAIPTLMQQMAVYFVQFRPYEGKSLYCKLNNFVKNEGIEDEIFYSTINYDCILDFSMLKQGLNMSYFPQDNEESIPLFKLHGSCNMFSQKIDIGKKVRYDTNIGFEGGIQAFIDTNKVMKKCLIESGLSPVMCLYMKCKPLQISPSVIEETQNIWANRVSKAEIVFCIGINPLPEDKHIWNPLSRTSATVYYIGDEGSFKKWDSEYRKGPSEFVSSKFHLGFPSLKTILRDHAIKWGR